MPETPVGRPGPARKGAVPGRHRRTGSDGLGSAGLGQTRVVLDALPGVLTGTSTGTSSRFLASGLLAGTSAGLFTNTGLFTGTRTST
ncbi:hypothetical protein, partial [Streptomyces sp. NPDC055506]